MVQFQVFDLQTVARIVGAPKAATGLSEAREAAGATAELRIARVCNANSGREMLCISRFFCEAKSHPKKCKFKTRHLS